VILSSEDCLITFSFIISGFAKVIEVSSNKAIKLLQIIVFIRRSLSLNYFNQPTKKVVWCNNRPNAK